MTPCDLSVTSRDPCAPPPLPTALSPALEENIQHDTMLDELVFWTYKYEFPTKLVCLLLYMLPDQRYKVRHTTRPDLT